VFENDVITKPVLIITFEQILSLIMTKFQFSQLQEKLPCNWRCDEPMSDRFIGKAEQTRRCSLADPFSKSHRSGSPVST
jgi:hypothetical protein